MAHQFEGFVFDGPVVALTNDLPKAYNAAFNQGLPTLMGAFLRKFSKERLSSRAGIRVRRRVSRKAARRGQPSVPAKARAAGFYGRMFGRGRIDRKLVSAGTGNPLMKIHERGGRIPEKATSKLLAVKARTKADEKRYGKLRLVPFVIMKPRLGFMATWRAFRPEASDRINKIMKRAKERVERGVTRRDQKKKAG